MKEVMLKGIEMYESLIKSVVSAGGCAERAEKAKEIHPQGKNFLGHRHEYNSWGDPSGVWVDRPYQVGTTFLGKAGEGVCLGVIYSVISE